MKKIKTCIVCSSEFETLYPHTKSCSEMCALERNRYLTGCSLDKSGDPLPPNFMGKLHEYKVCIDLGMKGYDIYYSFLPQQKYDLLIRERVNGKIYIVEVKTGYKSIISGNITKPKHKHKDWDVLAVVVRASNEIVYYDKNMKVIEM